MAILANGMVPSSSTTKLNVMQHAVTQATSATGLLCPTDMANPMVTGGISLVQEKNIHDK